MNQKIRLSILLLILVLILSGIQYTLAPINGDTDKIEQQDHQQINNTNNAKQPINQPDNHDNKTNPSNNKSYNQLPQTNTESILIKDITKETLPDLSIYNTIVSKQIQAESFFSQNKYIESIKIYEEVLTLIQKDSTCYKNINNQYIKIKCDTKTYKKALIIYLTKLSQYENALNFTKILLNNFPDDAIVNNLHGWSMLASGNIEQSYQYLSRAIVIDPNLPEGYLNLGEYYARKNDIINAKKFLDKAIELSGLNSNTANVALSIKKSYNIN